MYIYSFILVVGLALGCGSTKPTITAPPDNNDLVLTPGSEPQADTSVAAPTDFEYKNGVLTWKAVEDPSSPVTYEIYIEERGAPEDVIKDPNNIPERVASPKHEIVKVSKDLDIFVVAIDAKKNRSRAVRFPIDKTPSGTVFTINGPTSHLPGVPPKQPNPPAVASQLIKAEYNSSLATPNVTYDPKLKMIKWERVPGALEYEIHMKSDPDEIDLIDGYDTNNLYVHYKQMLSYKINPTHEPQTFYVWAINKTTLQKSAEPGEVDVPPVQNSLATLTTPKPFLGWDYNTLDSKTMKNVIMWVPVAGATSYEVRTTLDQNTTPLFVGHNTCLTSSGHFPCFEDFKFKRSEQKIYIWATNQTQKSSPAVFTLPALNQSYLIQHDQIEELVLDPTTAQKSFEFKVGLRFFSQAKSNQLRIASDSVNWAYHSIDLNAARPAMFKTSLEACELGFDLTQDQQLLHKNILMTNSFYQPSFQHASFYSPTHDEFYLPSNPSKAKIALKINENTWGTCPLKTYSPPGGEFSLPHFPLIYSADGKNTHYASDSTFAIARSSITANKKIVLEARWNALGEPGNCIWQWRGYNDIDWIIPPVDFTKNPAGKNSLTLDLAKKRSWLFGLKVNAEYKSEILCTKKQPAYTIDGTPVTVITSTRGDGPSIKVLNK